MVYENKKDIEQLAFSSEKHGKTERHYAKVFPGKLWDSFSSSQKEEWANQIDYLEKEVLGDKAIKIRVRPRIIKKFAKLTGVPDFKGGGYWGDTVYLGHTSDLFNPQIVRHEGIHILQQREYGTTRLGGFISWVNESLFKGPKKYKKEHRGKKITLNDLSTKPRLELEAYSNQFDPDYMENREDNAYLEYDGKEGLQKGLRKIEKANYDLDKENLCEKLGTATDEKNREELLNAEHDLSRLDEIKNISKDRDMYVFNYVEKINDILCVIKLLEEKVKQLKKLDNLGKLKFEEEGDLFDDKKNQYKASPTLQKDIALYKNEIANENLSYMLEDNFISIDVLENTIKDLYKKCHEYRKTPVFLRLEEYGHHETSDTTGDITKALIKYGYTEDMVQKILDEVRQNEVDWDLFDMLEKYGLDENRFFDILEEVKSERLKKEQINDKKSKERRNRKDRYIAIPLLFYKN